LQSSEVDISGCTFYNNEALEDGGGVFANNPSTNSNINNNTFESNDASGNGGGLFVSSCSNQISIDDNTFISNTAYNGGGIYFDDLDISYPSTITVNTFNNNIATNNGGGLFVSATTLETFNEGVFNGNQAENGAGAFISETEISNFTYNDFDNNTANTRGGGAYLNESKIKLKLCKIINNNASNGDGGGVCIIGEHSSGDDNEFFNNLIAVNTASGNGGGIYTERSFVSYNNTIADNQAQYGAGGGIFNSFSTATIVNTILWGNTATANPQAYPTPDGNIGYSYSCCPTVANCPTCTTADPDFIGGGNYGIYYNSSCYNTGNKGIPYLSEDLIGAARIVDNEIDIGAYEDPTVHVCGQLANINTTWTNQNDNGIDYVILCDFEIQSGYSLDIAHGVEIGFYGSYKIDVNGTLTTPTSDGNLILFHGIDVNTWEGIRFISNSNTSNLSYCEITDVDKPSTGSCLPWNPDYSGAVYIDNSPNITISHCKIHDNQVCSHGGGVFILMNSDVTIYKNEIYNNISSGAGGGIYVHGNSSPDISENSIINNSASSHGGGIAVYSGQPKIYLNIIEDNVSGNCGGGFYNSSTDAITIEFYNNLLDNNTANINGGGLYVANNTKTNIYNCTIADNTATNGSGGGIYQGATTSFSSINNIVWGNDAYYSSHDQTYPAPDGNNGYSYCCIENSTTPIPNCSTCVIDNPNFIGSGNYMISYLPDVTYPAKNESSCYNNGNSSFAPSANDLEGNDREIHGTIDIGAYEDPCYYGEFCNLNWTNNPEDGIDYIVSGPMSIPLNCSLSISPGTTIAFKKTAAIINEGTIIAKDVTHSNYITFTAFDEDDGWYGIDLSYNSNNNEFEYCIFEKVKKTVAGGKNDFNSSGTVYLEESDNTSFAFCIFRNNSVSHAGGGLFFWKSTADVSNCEFNYNQTTSTKGGGIFMKYPGSSSHSITKCTFTGNIAEAGGGGISLNGVGTISISGSTFSQNKTNTGMADMKAGGGAMLILAKADDIDATIFNCQFSNNEAINDATHSRGGGILAYNPDPTNYTLELEIYNSTISSNEADADGGGIFLHDCHSSVKIYNSYIQGNSAEGDGGGIYIDELDNTAPLLYNNLITGNEANGNGGGIYFESSNPNIYSCTIADNEVGGAGGGFYSPGTSSYPDVLNTIIYDNSPDEVDFAGDDADDDDAFYNYCNIDDFTGFPTDYDNIDSPPLWVDGYHVKYGTTTPYTPQSPCINTGQPSYTPPGSPPYYDLDGNARVADSRIDMGCYENDNSNPDWRDCFQ
jgi:parallel beta-helix repeat protein/predicted outer membrane repeat protein